MVSNYRLPWTAATPEASQGVAVRAEAWHGKVKLNKPTHQMHGMVEGIMHTSYHKTSAPKAVLHFALKLQHNSYLIRLYYLKMQHFSCKIVPCIPSFTCASKAEYDLVSKKQYKV